MLSLPLSLSLSLSFLCLPCLSPIFLYISLYLSLTLAPSRFFRWRQGRQGERQRYKGGRPAGDGEQCLRARNLASGRISAGGGSPQGGIKCNVGRILVGRVWGGQPPSGVYIYIYMHVCMYVRMYVCICVSI